MQQHIFTTGLARRALLGATVASALAATPALAAEGPQGVRAGHNVTVFHNIDMVASFGSAVGEQTRVDLYRGADRIATAQGAAVSTPEGGAVEVNHGPLGAPQPGDCWDGATPDVKPGDRIVVTNPGGAPGVDEAIVDNITIDTVRGLDANPATGNEVVAGTVPIPADADGVPGNDDDDDGIPGPDPATRPAQVDSVTGAEVTDPRREIWVSGTAQYVDAAGALSPIPLTALDSGEFLGPTDNQLRMNPTSVVAGPGGAGTYTAKYIEGQLVIDRNRNNIPVATILQQLEEDAHGMGYGHTAVLPPVSMLVEGMGEQATAAPGCESSPKEASSLGTTSVRALNIANTGAAAADPVLTIGGWAAAGVTSADVVLTSGATSVTKAATLGGGTGQQGLGADFTKADLAGLAQGPVTARLSVGGTPVGASKTIQYDTVAPAFAVNLAEGTYTGTQRLIVTGDPVTYQLDGGPTRSYAGVPIELGSGNHTVVLTSTDAAGNTTTRTLRYVINGGSAPTGATAPAVGGGTPQPPVQPLPLVANSRTAALPAATMLRGQRRVTRAAAKRSGLLARFSAPQGARRATLRVFRSRNGVLRLVGTKSTSVRRGANSVELNGKALRGKLTPGLYLIQVTLRSSSGKAGAPATQFVRVTR